MDTITLTFGSMIIIGMIMAFIHARLSAMAEDRRFQRSAEDTRHQNDMMHEERMASLANERAKIDAGLGKSE